MRKNRSRKQTPEATAAVMEPASEATAAATAVEPVQTDPPAAEQIAEEAPTAAARAEISAEPEQAPAPSADEGQPDAAPASEPEPSAAVVLVEEAAPELRMFRPGEVIPWPGLNPRTHFDPEAQAELDDSVRRQGVRQPAVVHLREEGPHWLVIGERRLRACANTGRQLPAVVGTFTEAEAFELALIENIQRADLTPMEEARGFRRWLNDHEGDSTYTLAERIGKSQPYVANRLALLKLPSGTQKLVEDGLVTATQARDAFVPFAGIPEDVRAKVFDTVQTRIREHFRYPGAEGLNLSRLREIIGRAAVRWSKPLSAADAEQGEAAPLFNPTGHDEECGCKGPVWTYRLGGAPTRRCFNLTWWMGRQNDAQEEQRRAEEARRADLERRRAEAEQAAQAGQVPTEPVPATEAKELFSFAEVVTDSASDYRELRTLLDPDLLPVESLRVVENFEPYRARFSLVCIDRAAVEKATRSASQARLDLLRRLTEERNARERDEAAALDLRHPEVIADLLTELPKVTDYALHRIADQHEIRLPQNSIERKHWLALPKRELQLFARIVVLRIRAGTLGSHRDPMEAEAVRRVGEVYAARLEAVRSAVPLPGKSPADRMRDLAERFHTVYAPLAEAGADLSESAGEQVQQLQEIVAAMETLHTEAVGGGQSAEGLDCADERAMYEEVAAAYAERFGPEAEAPAEGEPAAQEGGTGQEEAAPPEESAAEAPADELTPRRARGGRRKKSTAA
ncbi:MAG TPA: ParB/RepB/Spo0J family partition protein [Longimicrobiaceae bacterium]|nr:ParB/RepB/Spo0J family partition protein [Longimicrobiaceae bacterium]